ncbi:esterase/lipase family protein [Noviherbaspirillum galbum]|uniref:Alpha/beta hydrolase n=1 Tax=Noviherbaspirillum galbum TaxID=2709383 RepID=A0A6B3SR62_9BURK|nr:alpha/beta hydrolase [Noviherbaspirillum galbum]NEX63008.1 alpha/beta hydrolase [Noviherbaspirillum galbum]
MMPSSTLLLALEPYHAVCNFIAGHSWVNDALPQGDGHPVLVYPGLGVSGTSTTELRTRLSRLGYQVYDWELGVGVWPCTAFDTWLGLLEGQLLRIRRAHDSKVSLVGWSLGGLYARELAKRFHDDVRQVITLGTPIRDVITEVDRMWVGAAPMRSFFDPTLPDRFARSPSVRCASIYSRTDGLIDWRNCIDHGLAEERNIEIRGVSHFGLVHHPDVLRAISVLLAEP